jgi:hypothetical protein
MIGTFDIYWAAGFLEGEGYFGTSGGGVSPIVVAKQVQREPLDRLVRIFGGKVKASRNGASTTLYGNNPIWSWQLTGRNAAQVSMTLYTLMSPKRRQSIEQLLVKWRSAKFQRGSGIRCPKGIHALTPENTQVRIRSVISEGIVSTYQTVTCKACASIRDTAYRSRPDIKEKRRKYNAGRREQNRENTRQWRERKKRVAAALGMILSVTCSSHIVRAQMSKWQPAVVALYESNNRNIPNYRFDAIHTAGGHFQITDTNWRDVAPTLGIDLAVYPNAMSAPEQLQGQVAGKLYALYGYMPWVCCDAPLRRVLTSAADQNSPRGQSGATPGARQADRPPATPGAKPHRWLAFSDPASANWP